VPNGFKVEYTFIGRDIEGRQIATIVKDAWSKIGVDVQLRQLDIGTFFDLRSKSDFEITAAYADEFTSDIAADDELAIILYGGPASGFNAGQSAYSDPKATRTLRQATDTISERTRKLKFAELQRYAIEKNPPWIPYAFIPQRSGVRDEIQGFKTLVTGWWRLEDVWLKQ
jgi:ABC-type transport system substrate-binding protein